MREEAARLQKDALWRTLDDRTVAPGPAMVNLSSNDYLGFAQHPEVMLALTDAVERYGAGGAASRLLSGPLPAHEEAEDVLAGLVRCERALLFASGYAANAGIIPALASEGDVIFSDALNHASIIDGCRLSRAQVLRYQHRDLDHLEALLKSQRGRFQNAWIITEAVFSMDGDAPDLRALSALATHWGAWLYVDEAHALGVVGPEGRGLCAADGITPELLVGTLGKAFGLAGAFAAGSDAVISLLVNRARSFVYSTAVLPGLAGAVPRVTEMVRAADAARSRLRAHVATVHAGIATRSALSLPAAAIVPIPMGTPERAIAVSKALQDRGFETRAIRPPTVPKGTSRLRCVPTAAHSSNDLRKFVHHLTQVLA